MSLPWYKRQIEDNFHSAKPTFTEKAFEEWEQDNYLVMTWL